MLTRSSHSISQSWKSASGSAHPPFTSLIIRMENRNVPTSSPLLPGDDWIENALSTYVGYQATAAEGGSGANVISLTDQHANLILGSFHRRTFPHKPPYFIYKFAFATHSYSSSRHGSCYFNSDSEIYTKRFLLSLISKLFMFNLSDLCHEGNFHVLHSQFTHVPLCTLNCLQISWTRTRMWTTRILEWLGDWGNSNNLKFQRTWLMK